MSQLETLQVLRNFSHALIEEIQVRRPEYLTSAFTVAEIYQNLLPYGSNRERIGIELNGDYEDALLRLLAGEGGFLILESEPALRDLQAELETPNPNVALYRDYAAVDVRLSKACLDMTSSAVSGKLDPMPQTGVRKSEPDSLSLPLEPIQLTPGELLDHPQGGQLAEEQFDGESEGSRYDFGEPRSSGSPLAEGDQITCHSCEVDLPVRRDLNFCPFCGMDLKVVRCRACSKELKVDWRFCVSCGSEVGI